MSDYLTIKQIPDDLKKFWAEEAKRNTRSIQKEIISVLEAERVRRNGAARPAKNMVHILEAARRLQSYRVIDDRPVDEVLYDVDGMPK